MFLGRSLGALPGVLILPIPKLKDSAVSTYEHILLICGGTKTLSNTKFSFEAYIDVFKHEKT